MPRTSPTLSPSPPRWAPRTGSVRSSRHSFASPLSFSLTDRLSPRLPPPFLIFLFFFPTQQARISGWRRGPGRGGLCARCWWRRRGRGRAGSELSSLSSLLPFPPLFPLFHISFWVRVWLYVLRPSRGCSIRAPFFVKRVDRLRSSSLPPAAPLLFFLRAPSADSESITSHTTSRILGTGSRRRLGRSGARFRRASCFDVGRFAPFPFISGCPSAVDWNTIGWSAEFRARSRCSAPPDLPRLPPFLSSSPDPFLRSSPTVVASFAAVPPSSLCYSLTVRSTIHQVREERPPTARPSARIRPPDVGGPERGGYLGAGEGDERWVRILRWPWCFFFFRSRSR